LPYSAIIFRRVEATRDVVSAVVKTDGDIGPGALILACAQVSARSRSPVAKTARAYASVILGSSGLSFRALSRNPNAA
jgi:hypothetical protein